MKIQSPFTPYMIDTLIDHYSERFTKVKSYMEGAFCLQQLHYYRTIRAQFLKTSS